MGWRTVADVRDYSRATGSAYTVAIMLAERAPDETKIARPGIDRLALDARVNRSTAQRAIKKLVELGEIEKLGGGGGRGDVVPIKVLVGPEFYEEPYIPPLKEGGQPATLPQEGPQRRLGRAATASSDGEEGPQGAPRTLAKASDRSGGPSSSTRKEPDEPKERPPADRDRALKLCRWLSTQADETKRDQDYSEAMVEGALWLLDNVPREEIKGAVAWAHTRAFWASRVRTAGRLRQVWEDLRAEWRGATRQNGNGRSDSDRADSDDLRALARQLEREGR